MIVFEAKLRGEQTQYRALDEALRTARFIRNSCIRYWMDNKGIGRYDLSKYCAVLASEFEWADNLNSIGLRRLMQKGRGRQSLGFSITARKKYQGRKDFPNSKSIKLTYQSSIKLVGGSYQAIG